MHKKRLNIVMSVLLVSILIFTICIEVKGTSWSVSYEQLTTHPYYDGFPAFTQTKDGRTWFVWSREIEGNLTLYYKVSSDQGRTWSEEMNLTEILAPGENQNPSIMQAKNGTIWVAWTSDRPPELPEPPPESDFYMNATPAHLTIPQGSSDSSTISLTSVKNFNDTVNLYSSFVPGITSVLDPNQVYLPQNETVTSLLTVTVDTTATPGNYTLTIIGEPLNHRFLKDVDITLEITTSTALSPSNLNHVSPSSAPSADSSATAMRDYEIYYKTSNDNGETWSKNIQLTNNNVDDLCPAIIQLTNGTIMVFWQTYISESFNIVYKTTTDGVSWSDTKQLTIDPADDKTPAATQTKDGKIWVAWASNRYADYEILYKIYDGVTWSVDLRLTENTNSDLQPAILQTADEEIMIFWASGKPTGTFDVYYKYSSDYGATWSDRTEFTATNYEDIWPAVMVAEDTKIWVAWVSNEADQPDGNWEIYFRTSLPGDVNEDGNTNVVDLTLVSLSYGSLIGEPDYNPFVDINKDGIVDMKDLSIVAGYLGET
jgi:hypothetical protein